VSFNYKRRSGKVISDLTLRFDRRPTMLIGPNGAGKSTLLKLLTRQLKPTTGSVVVSTRLGYAAQHTPALPGFRVAEQIRYASWLAGVRTAETGHQADRALMLTDLAGLADRPATELSGGELARLGIACALAGAPSFLLLDEPSASLDPLARRSVTGVLAALSAEGIGLLVSSHTATDLAAPFERLVVLDRGTVRFDGGLPEFFTGPHHHPVVAQLAQALGER
jgi:ABC-2 type transport system ATP-binding protein